MNTCERLMQTIEAMYSSKPVIDNNHKPRMVFAKDGTWVLKSEVLKTISEEAARVCNC